MWKKLGYGGLVLLLIYFIYAVFFKKIPTPLEQMQKDMKAKKVMYRLKDDAIIYADEQIGSEGDEVIRFKNVENNQFYEEKLAQIEEEKEKLRKIMNKIEDYDINNITPMDAMKFLFELKENMKKDNK